MDTSKLQPILNKESTLKTANARELEQASQDVLQRYQMYALTHVPLGETSKQLANLQRVITKNKTCAIGTIVGPYGYGKTSTAVHLWNELRQRQILTVPPFLWVNLQQLVDAVYYWTRFEFGQGPAAYLDSLESLYEQYAVAGLERLGDELDPETARDWFERGLLNLKLRPQDVVTFFSEVADLAQQAGYHGLAIFTDELQATVAEYKPSRDQFFNDLFQLVKDTLGRPGNWALINSMDDDTEGIISRLRADLLQRMQHSALYFRVEDVYDRRQYPAELWQAFAKRFGFDGSEVILPETLESIGQIASRRDLGAGPRMVTNALSLAVGHYEQARTPYTPLRFVKDFLDGLVRFDQRGKFPAAVKKALENVQVAASDAFQDMVKLLAAYPAGCSEEMLVRFDMLDSFRAFPPLARKELVVRRAEGHTLRYLLEQDRPPEQIEQRLTQEFVARYAPGPKYAQMAADGFLEQVLLEETFSRDWKASKLADCQRAGVKYQLQQLEGTFDRRYPQRNLTVAIAVMPQSSAPDWQKLDPEADIELRFEFNYGLSAVEPSLLLVAPERPDVAIFQFNLNAVDKKGAQRILPDVLFDYYNADQMTPQLALALVHYMFAHSGDLPDDIHRVRAVAAPLRQFALTLLLGEEIQVNRDEFASGMVGYERIKDLFRAQCQLLYPRYQTLITGRRWQQELQQYNYALERVINDEGVAVARGRQLWETTKENAADAFTIPKRSLTRLETLLDSLEDMIVKEEYSGRRASSRIRLRFQLHPLEEQWLEELEESKETTLYEGMQAPAVYAIELIRKARDQGYILEEVKEIMGLMKSRQFVILDQQQNMLIRHIDDMEDIKNQVQSKIDRLAEAVDKLEEAVPEFDRRRIPLRELRERLEAAGIREEAELLKSDIRRHWATVKSFAASHAADRREKHLHEVGILRNLLQSGVPQWLSRPFASGPLHDLLEQQRQNYAGAFETTLREIRQLALEGSTTLQNLPEPPIESLVILQAALPELCRASERLQTRLQSYTDIREDMDAWRRLIEQMTIFTEQAKQITEKYGSENWEQIASKLWQQARDEMMSNPLNLPTLHQDVGQQLANRRQQLDEWLQNRREDYEQQRQRYEDALQQTGVEARLRIPFNSQHPAESYDALVETVQQYLSRYLDDLRRRLNATLQKMRYAILVQRVDLAGAEKQAKETICKVDQLRRRISPELLRDMTRAETKVLHPLQEIFEQEKTVTAQVQQALQKRSPDKAEADLLNLLQVVATTGEADLYSLIMRQLDQYEDEIDLSQLMQQLQGLFQKNQIGIRIRVL
jgi:uncharacterized protein YoxC